MDAQIVLTKILPPRPRPGLTPRALLEDRRAERPAHRPLTLLCAPAGFGKTAALTRQIALLPKGTSVAWISADSDDDLHRFLQSLFLALEPADLPWRTEPDALIAVAVDERAAVGVVLACLNALATYLQRLLVELVGRYAFDQIVAVGSSVEYRLLETPGFYDQLRRALNSGDFRIIDMVTSVTQLIGALLTTVSIAVVLVILSPLLLGLVVVAAEMISGGGSQIGVFATVNGVAAKFNEP